MSREAKFAESNTATPLPRQSRAARIPEHPAARAHSEVDIVIRPVRMSVVAVALMALPLAVDAQDRLKSMPGHEQYQKMAKALTGAYKPGTLSVTWKDDGKAFEYRIDDKLYRFDVAAGKAELVPEPEKKEGESGGDGKARPGARAPGKAQQKSGGRRGENQPAGAPLIARGRQAGTVVSPDGKFKAIYRDRNIWLVDAATGAEVALTTDGNEKDRIKNGSASWVYGEELFQNSAMWWSPDSRRLAYYRFDESQVPDYYLTLNQTALQSKIDAEPYPKAGAPNPIVDLFIHDLADKKTVRVDVRDGRPFGNDVVGHYVYHVSWSADGKELLFNRTNRKQNVMEFVAANPETGYCRVIVREEWPQTWVENSPPIRWLSDNKRFIWTSERTGFRNLYLYDISGELLATLTNHPFEVANIVRVDEKDGVLWYMARSGDNPMKLQLHRVGLDGQGDRRLTDPKFHHLVNLAPDGKHFIDTIQTHNIPPSTRLVNGDGQVVAELHKSDLSKLDELGVKRSELFTFKAADGTTDLYGVLHFPSTFDPNKKYPLLLSVYAGPHTNGASEVFAVPAATMRGASPQLLTEYGFLVATLDARSAAGRGKRFIDAIYQKLGVTEIDDLAAGVRALGERPYVDKNRVGIFGGSYGGFASILCLLRHPDLFHAACASSPVTDYRLYDSIYTERYMGLPQDNKEGYDAGSALTHVNNLKGRLMIFFGTADNNVHPSNSMQLIRALQRAGKSFEVQIGPDQGHTGISQPRMMEFFIENLVLNRERKD